MVGARVGLRESGARSPVRRLKRSARAPPPESRPRHVREVLLDEGYLGLHGQLYVGETSAGAAVARDARQYPPAPLLVHQPARAVYRVDDDTPDCVRTGRAARQHDLARGQPLPDQDEGRRARDLALEELDEQFLADAVDGVDRVALLLPLDRGQRLHGRALAGLDHRVAYQLVQPPDGLQQAERVVCGKRGRHTHARPLSSLHARRAALKHLVGDDPDQYHGAHHGEVQRAGYAQQVDEVLQDL